MTYTVTDTIKEKVDLSTQWDTAQRQDQRQNPDPDDYQIPSRKGFNYWLLIPTTLAIATTTGVVLWLRRRFTRGN